jgi:hypothetical protein
MGWKGYDLLLVSAWVLAAGRPAAAQYPSAFNAMCIRVFLLLFLLLFFAFLASQR